MGCGASSSQKYEAKTDSAEPKPDPATSDAKTDESESKPKQEELAAADPASADAKKDEGDSKPEPQEPAEPDPAKEAEEDRTLTEQAASAATAAGLNVVGAAATGGGGAVATVGSALAFGFCSAANAATFGMCDSIDDAADDYYEDMIESKDNTVAEWRSLTASNEFFNSTPSNAHPDWMKDFPDSVPISELYIPGTHDTMARYGGDLAECQSWTLLEQLNSGIRAFDIRCKHDGDDLPCYHGIISQQTNFKEHVAKVFEDFLDEHPREAILVRMKKEGESGEHKCNFNDLTKEFTAKQETWNCNIAEWTTLGDVRGKVNFIAFGSALLLQRQKLDLQDLWKTGDEDEKVSAIREHATRDRVPNTLYVSFCSATGMDGNVCYKAPGALAWQVNKALYEEIDTYKPGVYMLDFVGAGTVDKMIAKNKEKQ